MVRSWIASVAKNKTSILTTALALTFVVACGKNNNNTAGTTTTVTPPTTTATGTGDAGRVTTGNSGSIELFTSQCQAPSGCPTDQYAFRTILKMEYFATNGWQFLANIDSQVGGDIIVQQLPAGTFRFSVPDASVNPTPQWTTTSQTVTITAGQSTSLKFLYTQATN